MAPVERLGVVGEAELHQVEVELFHRHTENVAAAEGAQVDSVPGARHPAEFAVEIVEKHLGVLGDALAEQGKEQVHIGPAAGEHKRQLVLHDGALYHCTRGDQSYGKIAFVLAVVTVAGADVQHGRQPSAERRGKVALVELRILDGIAVEHRHKAHKVAGVVERGSVHQHEVLVDGAAADTEAGGAFAGSLHSGHHLDDPYHVGFTHKCRELADDFAGDRLLAQLRQGELLPLALREDLGGFKHLTVFFEGEIIFDRAFRIDGHLCGDIAGIGTFDDLSLAVDLKGIEAVVVGGDSCAEILGEHHCTYQRLSAGRFLHVT